MQNRILRAISFVLVIALFIPCLVFNASAATYRTATNGVSNSYAGSVYYQNYLKVPITGDNVTDVLAIALSQLGYHEGSSTSDMAGNSSSTNNYTEFNYNMGKSLIGAYGGSTYPWCASFISWCLYQSHCTDQGSENDLCRNHNGDSRYVWREIGCGAWIKNLKSANYWKNSAYYGGSYAPKSGDLIFFRSGAHIGIVLYSDGTKVYTVEGNTSDASGLEPEGGGVYFKNYSLSSSLIDGYGTLPYKSDANVRKIDYSGKNPTTGYYIANATKYVYADEACTQYAYYGDGVQCFLPRFTMVMVDKVSADGVALKITFDGVTGYVKNTLDTARMLQITSAEGIEGPEDNLASDREYKVSVTNTPIVEEQWDTNYSALLTDGVASNTFVQNDASWFMLSIMHNATGGKGSVTVDFDNICDITKLRLNLCNNSVMQVKAPSSIQVYGSVDGVNYTKIGDMPIKTNEDIVYWSNLEVSNVQAGSVRFEFNLDGSYAYLNEIEVHGTATAEAYPREPEPDPNPNPNPNPDPNPDPNPNPNPNPNPDPEISVSFNSNGGAGEMQGETVSANSEYILPENAFTAPENMQFKGWSVNGEEYKPGDIVGLTEDVVIDALWEDIPVKYLRGDINMNGKIDARDYLLLKRAFFKTYQLTCPEGVADINVNGKLDGRDYLLLKRMFFNTYSLTEDLVYVS